LRRLEERLGGKLLVKSGRRLVPTEVGRVVYRYAGEIFGLARTLSDALEQRPGTRPLRRVVGIDDVLPKEIAPRVLEPVRHSLDSIARQQVPYDWQIRVFLPIRKQGQLACPQQCVSPIAARTRVVRQLERNAIGPAPCWQRRSSSGLGSLELLFRKPIR
jgi:hypothetical protein